MRRITSVALLAVPLLLGTAGVASADKNPFQFGPDCGQFFRKCFSSIHQHGPLYNYGPYCGYPPFEPYGYWNAYLQYTGPANPYTTGAGNMYGWYHSPHAGGAGHLYPLLHREGKAEGGLLHGHKSKTGCSTCGDAAASYVSSGDALERFTGVGRPDSSAAFYADSTTLTTTPGVVPVGFRSW
jgi:hypothetical protein